jgi:hypothetical protein
MPQPINIVTTFTSSTMILKHTCPTRVRARHLRVREVEGAGDFASPNTTELFTLRGMGETGIGQDNHGWSCACLRVLRFCRCQRESGVRFRISPYFSMPSAA